MRKLRVKLALGVATAGVLGVGAVAVAGGGNGVNETLTSYEEVPALSTPGVGEFHANINRSQREIRWHLSFDDLESAVTQAHIHFENVSRTGPIWSGCARRRRTQGRRERPCARPGAARSMA